MKLIYIKALLGIYGLVFLSSILQSCCKEEHQYTGNGHISVYQLEQDNVDLDTVSNSFFFKVNFEYQSEQVSLNEINLMNSAYATSCGEEQLNTLDKNTFRLSINPSFKYDDDSISSNLNLLELNTIDTSMHFHGMYFEIHFTQDFIDKSSFSDTTYKFTFTGETSDNIPISIEKEIWIKK